MKRLLAGILFYLRLGSPPAHAVDACSALFQVSLGLPSHFKTAKGFEKALLDHYKQQGLLLLEKDFPQDRNELALEELDSLEKYRRFWHLLFNLPGSIGEQGLRRDLSERLDFSEQWVKFARKEGYQGSTPDEFSDWVASHVRHLRSVLTRAPAIGKEAVLFRGVRRHFSEKNALPKVGDEIELARGFVSATMIYINSIYLQLTPGQASDLLVIHIPKGSVRGISMNALLSGGRADLEAEVLLNAGEKYRVNRIESVSIQQPYNRAGTQASTVHLIHVEPARY